MNYKIGASLILVEILIACLSMCVDTTFGQTVPTTAVPFLLISTSPEANGQGSSSVSRITDDNYSIIANPAHLGLMSLQSNASFSFYPTKVNWLPGLGLADITLNTLTLNGGINLKEYFDFPSSIGIAYSRVDLNLGTLYRTSSSPDVISTFNGEEHADAISIGACADFGIQVALGITLRRIESNLGQSGSEIESSGGSSSAWSSDYGILLNVPITKLIAEKIELVPHIAPIFDISFGSALTNVGGKMIYIDRAQADPLPRNISMGTSLRLGVIYQRTNLQLFIFTWSRQADNILVGRNQNGSADYRDLFGDLDFIKNVMKGEWTDKVEVSQGWEIGLGEIVFIRGGSFEGEGFVNIKTTGLGISATGLLKFLQLSMSENGTITYIAEHFALRYDQSKYSTDEANHPLAFTKFSSLSLTVKF